MLTKVIVRVWNLETMAGEAVGDREELRNRFIELEKEIRKLRKRMTILG